jgi:ABC-type Fe3+-hydroxamate transport system substrate-binding protein
VRSQLRHIRVPATTPARATRPVRPGRAALLFAAAAVILALACAACASSASHASAPPTKAATHSASPGPRAFAELAGTWSGHGGVVAIQPDGKFSVAMRTYRWCGQAPAPCDTISGNDIIDGDMASGQLTSISGETATGTVTHTTDPADTPEGQVKIVLDPSTDSITENNTTYCGNSAPAAYCGA